MSWQNGPIQVLAGWYGCDERPDWAATSYATMPTVLAKLQANLASNGGFLVIPPQHHLWLGFDPLPGVHKVRYARLARLNDRCVGSGCSSPLRSGMLLRPLAVWTKRVPRLALWRTSV
jgi:hypothetical protein